MGAASATCTMSMRGVVMLSRLSRIAAPESVSGLGHTSTDTASLVRASPGAHRLWKDADVEARVTSRVRNGNLLRRRVILWSAPHSLGRTDACDVVMR